MGLGVGSRDLGLGFCLYSINFCKIAERLYAVCLYLSVRETRDGGRLENRVDAGDLESDHRLHAGERGVSALLCRTLDSDASCPPGQVQGAGPNERQGGGPLDGKTQVSSRCAGAAVPVAQAASGLREFDERHVPRGFVPRHHSQGLQGDERVSAAHVSDTDQATGDRGEILSCPELDAEHLDGHERGEHAGVASDQGSEADKCEGPVPIVGAAARPDAETAAVRNPLGDRRRRERTGSEADGRGLGQADSRPMRVPERAVFLQAVGWGAEEEKWSNSR